MLHLMYYLLSWQTATAVITLYLVSLAFYRLNLHPLAQFPGPRLAAITRYYEGYFDLLQNGRYTFKIAELHKIHGPIIRISPHELHVNDPSFFDILYRQDAHYDKYDWTYDAWAHKGATVFTIDHHTHKARRQPLNPFFSKARVASQQALIHRHLDKLCGRLSKFAQAKTSFHLGAAVAAFARDIANDFVLGKSYNSLDRENFDVAMLAVTEGAGQVWRLTKFIRWFAPTLHAIPIPWIAKIANDEMQVAFRHLEETQQETKKLMAVATSSTTNDKGANTIVHEIMNSRLPPAEKTYKRVLQDVSTVTGAGFETTASCLRLIIFHVFSSADILHRLRAELSSAGIAHGQRVDVKILEQLPFLTAVLMEGLRLSPAIATRMARVAENTAINYNQWCIPARTPVGMTIMHMHLDEKLYPNPSQFDPDRWIEDGTCRKVDRGFAPFSKGARSCIGMYLAWTEMYIFLSDIVQRFDFHFEGASAEDFEFVSDQFTIGTRGNGALQATVFFRQG